MHVASLRWIDENPCFSLTKLKENSGRDRVLTEEEIQSSLSLVVKVEIPYSLLHCSYEPYNRYETGRIFRICWNHVDFDNKLGYLKETKNGSPRSFLLSMPSLTS